MNPMMMNLNNPIKTMFERVKSAGNPQMMMQQMLGQNPQIKQAMDYIQQNGGNPKEAFYKLAKEKGINPDDILNQLK